MAQTPKNPQQSQLQNSPPERKPHFSDRHQTQNHHTPRKHQKRHATRNHTTRRVNKRGISETTGLKKHHDNITKTTSPSLNKKKNRRQQNYKHHAQAFSFQPHHLQSFTRIYRPDTTRKSNTSGDWKPQAELVDRSLPAYTPAPSNPSFMGAFVPQRGMAAYFRERLRA